MDISFSFTAKDAQSAKAEVLNRVSKLIEAQPEGHYLCYLNVDTKLVEKNLQIRQYDVRREINELISSGERAPTPNQSTHDYGVETQEAILSKFDAEFYPTLLEVNAKLCFSEVSEWG